MPAPGRLPGILAAAVLAACAHDPAPRHVPARDPLGPYAAAVVLPDGLCFVSGQIGSDRASFESEVRSCLDAVLRELERAGSRPSDVVSATVYLTDMDLYGAFNALYAEVFPPPRPARACVAVAALPGGARVEVQVIARTTDPR